MFLGIDVGGTTVKCGLVDRNGNISNMKSYDTAEHSQTPQDFVNLICKIVEDNPETNNIGIGLPGLLTPNRMEIIHTPNIPVLSGLKLEKALLEKFPRKNFTLENDAKCAAMGEQKFGAGKNTLSFLLITLGTGVGSGLIVNNELFIGPGGNAAEAGMVLVHEGLSLEDYIGQNQIVAYAKNLCSDYPDSNLHQIDDLTVKAIYETALAGDDCANKVFHFVGDLLGQALVSVISLYDVHTIFIGGGVSGAFDLIQPRAVAFIKSKMPEYYSKDLKILRSTAGSDSGIQGAASIAM